MADKKISQLTSATTPLAGTEVLPIVQGGATTKVAVSDLTNGRAVTAGSMSIGGAINAGWGSNTRVVQTALSGALSGSTTSFRAIVSNNVYFDNTNWKYMYGIGASFYEQNAGNHYWFTAPTGTADSIANLTQVMTILQADNNLKVNVGNLVIGTAGKGIDFSINPSAPGMTSELLNDYEEGTFTPTYAGSVTPGTVTYTTQLGRYVKIGAQVYVTIQLAWSAVVGSSGTATVGGLPYANGSVATPLSMVPFSLDAAVDTVQVCYVDAAASSILMRQYALTGTTTISASAVSNAGTLLISGSYTTN